MKLICVSSFIQFEKNLIIHFPILFESTHTLSMGGVCVCVCAGLFPYSRSDFNVIKKMAKLLMPIRRENW